MIFLDIKVVPQSGVARITVDKNGVVKVHLKSPPEEGKANRELIKLFAHTLGISHGAITIILGATGRKKRIKIDVPLTLQEVMRKLGLEIQTKLA